MYYDNSGRFCQRELIIPSLIYLIIFRDVLIMCDDRGSPCNVHENIRLRKQDTVIVYEEFRENVKTFRWKCGRVEDAISIITHYVPTFSVCRTPMASSNRRGRSWKIIVEQPGGNVAITEGQHRDDYTLRSAMYQRITRHACLFTEHANINPIIRCLSYSISQFSVSAWRSLAKLWGGNVEIHSPDSFAALQQARNVRLVRKLNARKVILITMLILK